MSFEKYRAEKNKGQNAQISSKAISNSEFEFKKLYFKLLVDLSTVRRLE